ncbi:MAG TPA: CheR family methyltransferase [Polyangiaceae bacterium]|nr:CheR family methyltransferase [Polyangiaceae bacterium]
MTIRAEATPVGERTSQSGLVAQVLSIDDREFRQFSELIERETGIALSPSKKALLCSRLAKRLRYHGLSTFSEYHELVTEHDAGGEELSQLVNCMTTNFTAFFREAHHFQFMREEALPELRARASGARKLRIWSAGCSTGEEPYSIALTLAESLGSLAGWDIKILATDLDSDVLEQAERGVFTRDALNNVNPELRQRYFRALRDGSQRSQILPELSQLIRFRSLNLIDPSWPMRAHFDAIFCRNVAIYFARSTQDQVFARLAERLVPGGYLFTGHSESLYGLRRQLRTVGRTIYQRSTEAPVTSTAALAGPRGNPPSPPESALLAGSIAASREPRVLSTVLGSCVAVCLYDPIARVGGMNHFMLPGQGAVGASRYGEPAMRALLEELTRLGAAPARLRAKVFGAANLLELVGPASTVPELNARFAVEFLRGEGIAVESIRVGGNQPIQVKFATHTGRARVRVLERTHAPEALPRLTSTQPIEVAHVEHI